MARSQKLSSRQALIKVLSDKDNTPMSVAELVDAALPLTNLKGKTPKATLSHVLYVSPKFEKVGKAQFKLAPEPAVGKQKERLDSALQAQVEKKPARPRKNTRKRTGTKVSA